MSIFSFFKSWFTEDGLLNQALIIDLSVELHYKKLAINSAINLIANTLVRSKFRTYEKGKEVKGNNHYLFNVQPNQNQNATEFWHKLVTKLVYDNECLVIMQNDYLYVADNWEVTEYAFKENSYKKVTIGDYKLDKTFNESDVFFFKLNNSRMVSIIDSLYSDYGKLISASMNMYKRNNALRAILKMDISGAQTDAEQQAIDDLFNVQFKNFFQAEGSAVLPLQEGLELEEIFNESNGAKAGKDSRDVRALVDDIFDFVSIALHIPKGLLKGDLADVDAQTTNYIMYCIAPIAELVRDEINRKQYTKKEFLERTYLKIDTSLIKHVDIVQLATALDKLLASGTHSIDENRTLMDLEPYNEDWSKKHYVTKNYGDIHNTGDEDKESWTINERRKAQGKEPIPGGDAIYMPSTNIPSMEFEEE